MNALARTVAEVFALADLAALAPTDPALLATLWRDWHGLRRVRGGDLFLAVSGRATDGRRFIGDAIARGASAVLVDGEVDEPMRTLAGGVRLLASTNSSATSAALRPPGLIISGRCVSLASPEPTARLAPPSR